MESHIASRYPGHMIFKGMMAGGTSMNGISIDILKSSIQKYIRRGILDKAIYCILEWDLFHELINRDGITTGLKANSTNLINRLLIISCEDCTCISLALPILMKDLVDRYHQVRYTNDDMRRETLVDIVTLLCSVQKSRELSHIRSVYHQVYSFDGSRYTYNDIDSVFSIREHMMKYIDIYTFDRDRSFEYEFDRKSDACFYWFHQAYHSGDKKLVLSIINYVIDRQKDPIKIDTMNIIKKWYTTYKFKEIELFPMMIILIALRDQPMTIPLNPNTGDQWKEYLLVNLNEKPLSIDKYCIDMHTKQGRLNKMDRSRFAIEGALVENEDPLTNQVYKEIYTTFRQYQFNKDVSNQVPNGSILMYNVTHKISQSEIDKLYMIDTPRGQLLTGKHKKQVFIPIQGRYSDYIIKGPWKSKDVYRLNTMIFRMRVLTALSISISKFTIASAEDGNGYLFYRNISSIDSSKWISRLDYDKNIQPEGSNVRIIDRSSMGITQLHQVDREIQKDILFGKQYLFKGLIVLSLLRVGDVGFYNILVSNGIGYIIDYEENTTRTQFSSMSNFLAKHVTKYVSLLTEGINENRDMIHTIIKEIDLFIPEIKDLAQKHSCIYNIDTEWFNIKNILLQ